MNPFPVSVIRNSPSAHCILTALLVLLYVALPKAVSAQPGGAFNLQWFTVDGGGGTSAGGPMRLQGTIGQADAGSSSNANFKLVGGFWGGAGAVANLRLAGDCDGIGDTDIIELQQCINIFLGSAGSQVCPACNVSGDSEVDIIDLQGVINCFLNPLADNCPRIADE